MPSGSADTTSECSGLDTGLTVHSVQGITVGTRRQVKRLGIAFGDASAEHRARGLSYVASSRAETTDDYCYMRPVTLDRLGAIGTGKAAKELREKLWSLEAKQSPDAATLLAAGLYKPLLAWAEQYALVCLGTPAPWHDE